MGWFEDLASWMFPKGHKPSKPTMVAESKSEKNTKSKDEEKSEDK